MFLFFPTLFIDWSLLEWKYVTLSYTLDATTLSFKHFLNEHKSKLSTYTCYLLKVNEKFKCTTKSTSFFPPLRHLYMMLCRHGFTEKVEVHTQFSLFIKKHISIYFHLCSSHQMEGGYNSSHSCKFRTHLICWKWFSYLTWSCFQLYG